MELSRSQETQLKPNLETTNNRCPIIGYGLIVVSLFVAYFLIICANIMFSVTGIVYLAKEYSDIPDCASSYIPWVIIMVLVYISACFLHLKRSKDGLATDIDDPYLGILLVAIVLILGLITGLGFIHVLDTDTTCDVSRVSEIEKWTYCSLVYNTIVCVLLTGLMFYCCCRYH